MLVMATGDRIRDARIAAVPKLTQFQLADLAGIKRSRLAQYEAGRTEPPLPVLTKIAQALRLRTADLYDGDEPLTGKPQTPRTRPEEGGKIKVYGSSSAGRGNTSSIDPGEIDVPIELCRDDYGALVIEGDSMMPFLQPSDVTVYRDWHYPKVGSIMAATLANGDWVTKLVAHENGRFLLRSLDSRYEDITEDFTLSGYLVGIIRENGPEKLIRMNPYGLRPDA